LINQQIKPIKALKRVIESINKEKLTLNSLLILKKENKKIRVASRVPSPKNEIGKRMTKAVIVTEIDKYSGEILVIPILLAKKNIWE